MAKGKKDKKDKKKRVGYYKGAKVERARKNPREGYGYDHAYGSGPPPRGNQRRPKTVYCLYNAEAVKKPSVRIFLSFGMKVNHRIKQ